MGLLMVTSTQGDERTSASAHDPPSSRIRSATPRASPPASAAADEKYRAGSAAKDRLHYRNGLIVGNRISMFRGEGIIDRQSRRPGLLRQGSEPIPLQLDGARDIASAVKVDDAPLRAVLLIDPNAAHAGDAVAFGVIKTRLTETADYDAHIDVSGQQIKVESARN